MGWPGDRPLSLRTAWGRAVEHRQMLLLEPRRPLYCQIAEDVLPSRFNLFLGEAEEAQCVEERILVLLLSHAEGASAELLSKQ